MNTSKKQVQTMCITAMLIALGVLAPIEISPIKLVNLEPMSFTLGSHIAIMAAMFVSPFSAVSVALGTAAGFYLAGFTLPVVLRSLSHVVWVFRRCPLSAKASIAVLSLPQTAVFTLAIALLHALCEVLVVLPLYTGYGVSELVYLLFGLVGIGIDRTQRGRLCPLLARVEGALPQFLRPAAGGHQNSVLKKLDLAESV